MNNKKYEDLGVLTPEILLPKKEIDLNTTRGRLFSSLFAFVGVIIFIFGVYDYKNAQASKDWPFVEGKIVSSAVYKSYSNKKYMYEAKISFTYYLNNTPHTGNKVSFNDYKASYSSRAEDVVSRYPQGSVVRVYYNPQNPNESVLEPGLGFGSFFIVIVGVIFAFIGTTLLFFPNIFPMSNA